MRPRRLPILRDDAGASLLLVLALILFVGIVVSAALTYASTTIATSGVLAERTQRVQDVDGALKAAVNGIRGTAYVDDPSDPQACPPVAFPGILWSATVACQSQPSSGAIDGAVRSAPTQALLATAQGAVAEEDGVLVLDGGHLAVAGDVASNSSVHVREDGSMTVDGSLRAVTGCAGSVGAADTDCASAAVAVPTVEPPSAADVTRREVPDCPGGKKTVEFEPGYYDDAAALNALMGSCTSSTFWFPAAAGGAVYFFDFHDGEDGNPPGDHAWRISSPEVRLVGGGTKDPGHPGKLQIPGSCTSPLHEQDNAGVQFVFGGDSRLVVTAGQVELCGPGDAASGGPPVAILGADVEFGEGTETTAGPPVAPERHKQKSTSILTMTEGTGVDAPPGEKPIASFGKKPKDKDRVVDWDNHAAQALLDGSTVPGGQQAIIRVSGYDPADTTPPARIPAGSVLTYANLYVRHKETRLKQGADPVAYIQVSVTPERPGAPRVGPVAPPGEFTPGLGTNPDDDRNEFRNDTVDLLATPALQDEVTAHGFSGATVEWLVESTDDLDLKAELDSIQIAMGWLAPAQVRTQTTLVDGRNCVGAPTTAHPGSGACALVSTSDADGPTTFIVQGMGFAPNAAFDFRHAGIESPVFSDGLVARQLTFGSSSTSSRPALTVASPLEVLFRAYACPDGGCPDPPGDPILEPPWQLVGTATAQYTDPGPRIAAGGREVAVTTWSLLP